jgi:hypothetical protein
LEDYNNVTRTFNNFTVNNASCNVKTGYFPADPGWVIAGNLTVTAGTLTNSSNTLGYNLFTITGTSSITGTVTSASVGGYVFNGAVTVNSGGTLGGNTAWTCDSNASGGLTVNSGGTFSAPNASGAFTFQAFVVNTGATFTTNSGTALCDIGGGGGGVVDGTLNPITFYNLQFNNAGSSYIFAANVVIQNIFTISTTAYFYTTGTTLTMGTASASGTIANAAAMWACLGALTVTVQAASASYLCACTGTDWNWDRNAGTVWNLKWLDYQINATTGGGGVTINFTGNMTIDSWTTSLNDTLTLSNTITASGDVVAAGIITGNAAAFSAGSMSITGTYTATSGTTTITSKNGSSDAWNNSGTFTNSSGKVDFTGQSGTYHIHGNNSWYQLEISVTAACTYLFMNGQTQTIAAAGSVTMSGASGQLLTFNSVSGAADWSYILSPGAGQSHSYLDVAHSDASGGDAVQAFNGTNTNSGNNTNWIFTAITSTVMNEDYDWW